MRGNLKMSDRNGIKTTEVTRGPTLDGDERTSGSRHNHLV